jgi:hypothetical protein
LSACGQAQDTDDHDKIPRFHDLTKIPKIRENRPREVFSRNCEIGVISGSEFVIEVLL